jgi:pimeloyl-ACP methyl ester carboxylesterase
MVFADIIITILDFSVSTMYYYGIIERKESCVITSIIFMLAILAAMLMLIGNTRFSSPANAQAMCFDDNLTSPSLRANVLPVILVHGYYEPPSVWYSWESFLEGDHIPYCTVYFSDDECGTALDHAYELGPIVQYVEQSTGHNKVNIVAHSKGGLDAREYLANTGIRDVANLIMIGTPNGGDPIANRVAAMHPPYTDPFNLYCRPALDDIKVGADDTYSSKNQHTTYYVIYGDWNPSLFCPLEANEDENYGRLIDMGAGPNDGLVPISSVKSLTRFIDLGFTHHCHTGLLTSEEYDKAIGILMSRM